MLCNTFTRGVLAFVPRRSRYDTSTCMLSGKGELKNDLKYLLESLGSCGSKSGSCGGFLLVVRPKACSFLWD